MTLLVFIIMCCKLSTLMYMSLTLIIVLVVFYIIVKYPLVILFEVFVSMSMINPISNILITTFDIAIYLFIFAIDHII